MRRDPDVKDLNYQLGMYVGEYITREFLPTLSTDSLKTYTEIQVSEEDTERHRVVHDAFTNSYRVKGSEEIKETFKVYKALNDELAKKYLLKKKLESQRYTGY